MGISIDTAGGGVLQGNNDRFRRKIAGGVTRQLLRKIKQIPLRSYFEEA